MDAEYFKSVTILFSDISDFTLLSMSMAPADIVSVFNTIYIAIDGKLDNHEVYKMETISDSYMVASGLGVSRVTSSSVIRTVLFDPSAVSVLCFSVLCVSVLCVFRYCVFRYCVFRYCVFLYCVCFGIVCFGIVRVYSFGCMNVVS